MNRLILPPERLTDLDHQLQERTRQREELARAIANDPVITSYSIHYTKLYELVFLGYDVTTLAGARLDELFETGRREGRTVLTLSSRHPRRFADVPAVVLPRADPAAAVRLVADAHEPAVV